MKVMKSKMFVISFLFAAGLSFTEASFSQMSLFSAGKNNQKQFHIQDFKHEGIDVRFRYVNQKIQDLLITNTSGKGMDVLVFKKHFILGENESVIVAVPKIKSFYIYYEPYVDDTSHRSATSKIFGDTYKKMLHYVLPDNQEAIEKKF